MASSERTPIFVDAAICWREMPRFLRIVAKPNTLFSSVIYLPFRLGPEALDPETI
jgi:hypothetical protein